MVKIKPNLLLIEGSKVTRIVNGKKAEVVTVELNWYTPMKVILRGLEDFRKNGIPQEPERA